MEKILALDLEGTLISDAFSAIPRPGLREFLDFCEERFERLYLFTTVVRDEAWPILEDLTDQRFLPITFLDRLNYVEWEGRYKDIQVIPDALPESVRLVDDDGSWIHPDQRDFWIPVSGWEGDWLKDKELNRVRTVLEEWLSA